MQTVIHHQVVEWLETNKKLFYVANCDWRVVVLHDKKNMLFNGNGVRLGLEEGGKTTQSLPPS